MCLFSGYFLSWRQRNKECNFHNENSTKKTQTSSELLYWFLWIVAQTRVAFIDIFVFGLFLLQEIKLIMKTKELNYQHQIINCLHEYPILIFNCLLDDLPHDAKVCQAIVLNLSLPRLIKHSREKAVIYVDNLSLTSCAAEKRFHFLCKETNEKRLSAEEKKTE